MKILFSIPVHEKIEVIYDQINNFKKYNPDCSIILHISKSFNLSNIKEIELICIHFNNVYINPKSISTGLMDNSQLITHLLNIEYSIKNNIQFDYLSLHASNDMFVKDGLINYICKFDAGSSNNLVLNDTKWSQGIQALKDHKLKRILSQHDTTSIYGSQVEGIFMKKEIAIKILESINLYLKKSLIDQIDHLLRKFITSKYYLNVLRIILPGYFYGKEEIYFSSLIPIFTSNIGTPYVFVNWGNKLTIDKDDIKAITNNDMVYLSEKLKTTFKSETEFFAVKRVNRNIDDPLRKFINNL